MKLKKITALLLTAMLTLSMPIISNAAGWVQEPDGKISYQNDDGSKPVNQWVEIDGKVYFFDANGHMLVNTFTPDGKRVGEDGAYIPNQSVSNITYTPDSIATSFYINDYIYKSMLATYHFLEVTNLSPYTVALTISETAKDGAGNVIGASKASEEDIPSGCTVLIRNYFSDVSGAVSFDTSIQVKEEKYYIPVIQNIIVQPSDLKDKVIVTATNAGDIPAEFPQATVVFFKNGKAVDFGTEYLMDADYELKPGATISGQVNVYSTEYDSFKVFLSARRSKWK